ncbi:MAG: DUF3857 domain-containing transglutaminase family protein [Candidatus Oleimicrobiaceae bacterium]
MSLQSVAPSGQGVTTRPALILKEARWIRGQSAEGGGTAQWRTLAVIFAMVGLTVMGCSRGGDWARTIGWQDVDLTTLPAQKDFEDAEAVVVLDEAKVEVSGEWQMGFTLVERHRIVKIFSPRGQRFANIVLPYAADSRVEMLQARSISPDGQIAIVEPKRVYDVSYYPSFVFYSDQRAKLFAVPRVEPGSVIEYRFRVRTPTRSFWHSWVFQEDVPVMKSRFTVLAPGEWQVHHRVHGLNLQPRVTKAPAGFKATYVWEAANVPPLRHELSMPPLRECLARVELAPAGMKSWNDVAAWYHSLAAPQTKATKKVRDMAKLLVADCQSDSEKLQRLATWLRDNVRYLAVEIGLGGYQPHPAEEVLANRYGDCKDMATLLCAMAHAVELKAEHVLVSTWQNGAPDTSLPSPFHFNHAMVFSPEVGDSGLWVDPTDKGTPFGRLPWYDQGVFVLRVKEDGTGMVLRTPSGAADDNETSVRWHARLGEQGEAEVVGEVTLRGAPAWELRKELAALSKREQARWLENSLGARCAGVTLSSWQIEGMHPDNDSLKITYTFTSIALAVRSGKTMTLRPAQFFPLELPELFRAPQRVHPIRFRFGMVQHYSLHVDLPAGWKTLSPPVSDEHSCAYGSARWLWFPTSSGLFARTTYSMYGHEVPPAQYADFRAFLDTVQVRDLREIRIGKE